MSTMGTLVCNIMSTIFFSLYLIFILYIPCSAEVDACAVARLPRELASLPALALKCGLVGVCPVGRAGAWPPESARFFYSLMGNRFVEAVVEVRV